MSLWENFKTAIRRWALADEAKQSGVQLNPDVVSPATPTPPAPATPTPPAPAEPPPPAPAPVQPQIVYVQQPPSGKAPLIAPNPVEQSLSATEGVIRVIGSLAKVVKDLAGSGMFASNDPKLPPAGGSTTSGGSNVIDDSSEVVD